MERLGIRDLSVLTFVLWLDVRVSLLQTEFRVRKAARCCNFGDKLKDNLIEQFISGVNHTGLACKLFESASITTLAGAMEAANTFQLLEGDKTSLSTRPASTDIIEL